MANGIRGKRAGKRGNTFARSVKVESGRLEAVRSQAQRAPDEIGIYYDCFTETENPADHIVPRQSLTAKQLLGLFPQQVETEPLRQRDKTTGELVAAGDRVVWRSDRTLLRRGKPDQMATDIKRQTSRSKVISIQPGEGRPAVIEESTDFDLDIKL